MPLSKRARIEIYLLESEKGDHKRMRRAFESEFLHTFGGCTVIKGIKGLYLESEGATDFDRVSLVYADTPFDFDQNFGALSKYTDRNHPVKQLLQRMLLRKRRKKAACVLLSTLNMHLIVHTLKNWVSISTTCLFHNQIMVSRRWKLPIVLFFPVHLMWL